jgi:hypothetical protein
VLSFASYHKGGTYIEDVYEGSSEEYVPRKVEVTGGWRNCIIRSCIICTLLQILLCSNDGDRQNM